MQRSKCLTEWLDDALCKVKSSGQWYRDYFEHPLDLVVFLMVKDTKTVK